MSKQNHHKAHKLHLAEESAKTLHYWLMLIESFKHISSLILKTFAVTFPIVSYTLESVSLFIEGIKAATNKEADTLSRATKVSLSVTSLALMGTAIALPPVGGILFLIAAGLGISQGVYYIQQNYQKRQQLTQDVVNIHQQLRQSNQAEKRNNLFKVYRTKVHLQHKIQHRLIDHAIKTKLALVSAVGLAFCITPLAPIGVTILLGSAIAGLSYKWKISRWIKKRLHNKAKKIIANTAASLNININTDNTTSCSKPSSQDKPLSQDEGDKSPTNKLANQKTTQENSTFINHITAELKNYSNEHEQIAENNPASTITQKTPFMQDMTAQLENYTQTKNNQVKSFTSNQSTKTHSTQPAPKNEFAKLAAENLDTAETKSPQEEFTLSE